MAHNGDHLNEYAGCVANDEAAYRNSAFGVPLLRRVSILDLTVLTINVNEVYLFYVDQRIYNIRNSGGVREHPSGQV